MIHSRLHYIDWTRGVLMVLMALDHASLYWYQNRIKDEGLNGFYANITSLGQFLTRFITHPCAPGFIFISGFMMYYACRRRQQTGQPHKSITAHLMMKGLLLILLDFIFINRLGLNFGILACIGLSIILWSLLRSINPPAIFLISSLMILIHPFLIGSEPSYLTCVLFQPSRLNSHLSVLYPIIPWAGVMGLGIFSGRTLLHRQTTKLLLWTGVLLMILFIPLRLFTGSIYGDSHLFWLMSKYPPSPSFTTFNIGMTLVMMSGFSYLESHAKKTNKILSVLSVYGKVPLFFYITHRYLYGFIPNLTHTRGKYSLIFTYAIWLGGLFILYYLCKGYEKLRKMDSTLRELDKNTPC